MAAALRMGLHRYDPEGLSPIKHETRKRVFWTIRIMETYIAAVLGLPRTLNDDDIDQELPAEVDDEYITGEKMLQMPEGRLSLLAGFNAHIKLAAILGKIITKLYPTRKRKRSNKKSPELYTVCNAKAKEVERDLANWVRDLPVDLRPRSKPPLLLTRRVNLKPIYTSDNESNANFDFPVQGPTPSTTSIHACTDVSLPTISSLCCTLLARQDAEPAILCLCCGMCRCIP
jgi:hypothetical protein